MHTIRQPFAPGPDWILDEMPPCSRHDDKEDDQSERVRAVYLYAMGLLGGAGDARTAARSIARLHDHKGGLEVILKSRMPEHSQWAFRRAWSEVGGETLENITFLPVNSPGSTWRWREFGRPRRRSIIEEVNASLDEVLPPFDDCECF